VLLLGRPHFETGRVPLHHEERRAARGSGEHGVDLRHAAVGDELFGTGEPVPTHTVTVRDRHGLGLQARHVGAGLGLGDPVGHDQPFLADPAEPVPPLLLGATDDDRVDPERDGEKRGGHTQVDPRHLLGYAEQVAAAAAESAHLLGEEQQMKTELRPEHFVHQLEREPVLLVERQPGVLVQPPFGDHLQGLEHDTEGLIIEACALSHVRSSDRGKVRLWHEPPTRPMLDARSPARP
jgi:hypothetical protein